MSIIRTRSQDRLEKEAEEAALLAAAQAQAEAEEQIQGHLPREVLNIQRRLDLQQTSVDTINININKLTEMVANIAVSRPPQPSPPPDAPPRSGSTAQTQTPPHYHPTLSPIMEVSTPASTTPHATARPLQFGNLSPRHLHHSDFPSTSLPQQPTKPPPLPSLPPPHHIQQYTNPSTHPQYYNPPPSEPIPVPTHTASKFLTLLPTPKPVPNSFVHVSFWIQCPSVSLLHATSTNLCTYPTYTSTIPAVQLSTSCTSCPFTAATECANEPRTVFTNTIY
jgi:hypothetical protein